MSLCSVTVFLENLKGRMQIPTLQRASETHYSAHHMSVVELELLITPKEKKSNVSPGPHVASWAWSVVLKVVPRQPESGRIKMSGIQV